MGPADRPRRQAYVAAKGRIRLMAGTAEARDAYQIVLMAFDHAFYRATNPELNLVDFDPIGHYLDHGWREARDPAPWFSVRRYLARHPDIAAAGQEPLAHYLQHGAREGRTIAMSDAAVAYRQALGEAWRGDAWSYQPARPPRRLPPQDEPPPPPYSEAERQIVGPRFNSRFYAEAYPDVAEAGADLLAHFLTAGWQEGRDPTPYFSVREYLQANPDVAEAGINPFVHYILAGRAEGRAPRNLQGFRAKIIADLVPLQARIADSAERASRVQPAADFAGAVTQSRTGLADLHVTFSHDDYTRNLGGVQLCLQYESEQIARRGADHLHLCPEVLWPVLRRDQPAPLAAILNGRRIGVFGAANVARGLADLRRNATGGSFAIHNLLGHSVDEVLEILAAAGLNEGFFWLHDFTSLCAGYQLLRNDVQDCGAPPPESQACAICLYAAARMPQIDAHERLFGELRLTVVSPSQTTLDFWRGRWSYPAVATVVHPHVSLTPRRPAPAGEVGRIGPRRSEPRSLRLAFVGMPVAHKGWPVFAELATDFAADPRYRFLHLGARRDPRTDIEFHPVSVSLADPQAMRHALEALEVDVAVIWSIFRETFCLAAYEAIAAGAAIVAPPDSANVAALLAAGADGRVLADEAALRRALASGELADLARRVRKPRLYDLTFSGMTADLLTPASKATP